MFGQKSRKWPEALGSTVEEIAESLRKQGARGIPRSRKNCIIARSYKLLYPDGWSGLSVGYSVYTASDGKLLYSCSLSFNDCQITDPQGSTVLAEFMYRFDQGEFPDLIVRAIPAAEEVLANLSTEQRIAIGK